MSDRDRLLSLGDTEDPTEVARLKRRLARERAARHEAETISERVTRELYDQQQRLLLLREVVRIANDATGVESTLTAALRAVCEYCSWRLGHAWRCAADGQLDPTGLWAGGGGRFAPFCEATERLRLAPGVGLPGQVLLEHRAVWMLDFASVRHLPRVEVAAAVGLHSAVAFPILASSGVLGVLEFFTERVLAPDEELIELMAQVGTELGRVIEHEETAARLRHQATHDALTGLPNRMMICEELRHALSRLARRPDRHLAVVFVDLDGFKAVKDTLGHAAGDHVLREVAERLRRIARPHDLFGRLGGDEFIVLCEELTSEYPIAAIAERIQGALRRPFSRDGELFHITASISVTSARPDADPEQLIAQADAAMYRAKQLGRARCEVYSRELGARLRWRTELERDLCHASARGELHLQYQPVIDLRSGRIVGVEALLRWRREDITLMPAEFIPLAEETGLIGPIGAWVLDEALRQARLWTLDGAIDQAIWMSVNLSIRQLVDPELVALVADTLTRHALDPSGLLLEVTESMLLDNVEAGLDVLMQLKEHGVKIAIDDFGTGYASLTYLRRFPATALKIDRSFIDTLGDPRTHAIVMAMINLAHALGLAVIAEGVETPQQLAVLRKLGCDRAQGYLFARPLSSEAIEPLLRSTEQFTPLLLMAPARRPAELVELG